MLRFKLITIQSNLTSSYKAQLAMKRTRLSSKGQIVIPKAVRDARGWNKGTELLIEETRDGIVIRAERPKRARHTMIDEVAGCLKYRGTPKTIEEMKFGETS